MNVTMTMDEYQSLLKGVEIKHEARRKAEREKLDQADKVILMFTKIQEEMKKKGFIFQWDGDNRDKVKITELKKPQ